VLISLARRRLGEDRLRGILAPARAEAVAILERGQRDGTFASHLPAPVLALATEAVVLALLESQASAPGTPAAPGTWSDPRGEAAATAALITAGVEPAAAARYVRAAVSPGR
jgi:hypothetical protein